MSNLKPSDFTIDPLALDREWVRQPALYKEVADLAVDAHAATDQAAAAIGLEKAELDAAIRHDPEAFGLTKVTEPTVKATVEGHPDYQAAVAHHLDCKHQGALLEASLRALEHKKAALQGLVSLHGQSYFSAPTTDAAGREALDESAKGGARRRRRRPSDKE
jgi:hypothetical protein